MSPKRIVSIVIAVLNAILFVGLFLPYSANSNVMTALDPYSYIIIIFAIAGMVMCILDRKIEVNYLTGGSIVTIFTAIVINVAKQYPITTIFSSVHLGFYAYYIVGIALIVMTTIHGNMSGKRKVKSTQAIGNGPVQTTNSLNMNMPVNSFKSLPVKHKEKKKAPMDMLMSGNSQPADAQTHMGELGLQSINISKDNLTGAAPAGTQPVVQPVPAPQPAKPVELNVGSMFQSIEPAQSVPQAQPVAQQPVPAPQPVQQPVQQPVPAPQPQPQIQVVQQPVPAPQPQAQPAAVQQLNVQPAAQPQPQQQAAMSRPDLLAGSEMSGQLDTSPYNPNNNQGSGLFF